MRPAPHEYASAQHVAGRQTYSSRIIHATLEHFSIRKTIKEGHVSIYCMGKNVIKKNESRYAWCSK